MAGCLVDACPTWRLLPSTVLSPGCRRSGTPSGGFVYVNLDPTAARLADQAPDLAAEIAQWASDVASLTHAKRLTYDVKTNWKNVIDNFLECYHCHIAHKEFVALVDMETYEVKTHGIWSSHFAAGGKQENSAYDVSQATVTQHAVWWLWPNTCLLRYPGRGNFMVFQVLPAGTVRTLETWDFFLESTELDEAEKQSVRYVDEVLQQQDITLVESVQRGMNTPAFDQGRIATTPTAQACPSTVCITSMGSFSMPTAHSWAFARRRKRFRR